MKNEVSTAKVLPISAGQSATTGGDAAGAKQKKERKPRKPREHKRYTNEELLSLNMWTTAHVAQFLGCSPETVKGWRVRGGGPKFVPVTARQVRYSRSVVQQWLEDKTVGSTSEERPGA